MLMSVKGPLKTIRTSWFGGKSHWRSVLAHISTRYPQDENGVREVYKDRSFINYRT